MTSDHIDCCKVALVMEAFRLVRFLKRSTFLFKPHELIALTLKIGDLLRNMVASPPAIPLPNLKASDAIIPVGAVRFSRLPPT